MKMTRPGFLGNFVPLLDAVRAVASRIAISDRDADTLGKLNRVSRESPFELQLARSQVKSRIAQAQAADLLLMHLNQAASMRPAWFDASHGYPLRDEGVARFGMEALLAFASGKLVMSAERRGGQASADGVADLSAANLGFEANELIAFLDSVGVLHSLESMTRPEFEMGSTQNQTSEDSARLEDMALLSSSGPPNQNVKATVRPGQKAVSLIVSDFMFRGPLKDVLESAVQNARDINSYAAAFAELYRMAVPRDRPPPLQGVNAVDHEVLWMDKDPDVPEAFTEAQMARRYKTAKDRARRRMST